MTADEQLPPPAEEERAHLIGELRTIASGLDAASDALTVNALGYRCHEALRLIANARARLRILARSASPLNKE
jgi:hypothetical protein